MQQLLRSLSWDAVHHIIIAALSGTLEVFLIIGLGLILSHQQILTHQGNATLSQLLFNALVPCLAFSFILETIHEEGLFNAFDVQLAAFTAIGSGFVLGYLVITMVNPQHSVKPLCVLAISFGNAGQIPMLLMEALCEYFPTFKQDQMCKSRSLGYTQMFNITWTVMFWSFGYSYFTQTNSSTEARAYERVTQDPQEVDMQVHSGSEHRTHSVHSHPPHHQVVANAEEAGDILPQEPQVLVHSDDHNHNTMHVYHHSVSSSPNHTESPVLGTSQRQNSKPMRCYGLLSPPIIAIMISLLVSQIPKLPSLFLKDGAPLNVVFSTVKMVGLCAIPLGALVVGYNLYKSASTQKWFSQDPHRDHHTDSSINTHMNNDPKQIPFRVLFAILVSKMILLPLLGLVLLIVLKNILSEMTWQTHLIKNFLLYIEFIVPTANSMAIMCSLADKDHEAIGSILFVQFLFAPFLLSLSMIAGLAVISS